MAATVSIDVNLAGTISLTFKNTAGTLTDPSSMTLAITDSLGTAKTPITLADLPTPLIKDGIGLYHYTYTVGGTDPTGVWIIRCDATISTIAVATEVTWNIYTTGSLWVSVGEVKQYSLVKWSDLNYLTTPPTPFANEDSYNAFLQGFLIPRAQGHVNSYCQRDFDVDYTGSTIPEEIRDICARAASNMIQYMVMNKLGALITTGAGYKLRIPTQEVITPELAKLLDPWVTQPVTVPFAITRWGD